MYEMLEEFLWLFFYAAGGYCLWRFYDSFLESRLNSRKCTALFIVVFYMGLQEILNLISVPAYEKPEYESLRVIGNTALRFFFLLLIAVVFYKGTRRMIIFLFITFLSVYEIAYQFAYTIWQSGYHLLNSIALQRMEKGHLSPEDLIDIIYAGGYGMLFLTCLTSILILYGVLKNMIGSFRDKEYNIRGKELFFLLSPGLTGLLICTLLRIIMFAAEQEKITILYDRYPVLAVIVPVILLLSLLSIPYGVKVFQDMIELHRERSDRVILENQISSMQRHIEETEHIYAGIRSVKHDMQNTVSVMMRLAAESSGADTEHPAFNTDLQKYLAEFQQTFEQLEVRYKTGNTVVDTLLNMKYHEICHILPELELDADKLLFSESLHIQSYDMAVILGNALDNALEACGRLHEKKREAGLFIRLSSFRKGNMLFLEVENSFDGELIRKARSEFPETNKTNKEAHGMGLMNIKNAAEKYHGAVDWSADGKVFTLSVMMQNKEMGDDHVH